LVMSVLLPQKRFCRAAASQVLAQVGDQSQAY
jgi:hypothetical protein